MFTNLMPLIMGVRSCPGTVPERPQRRQHARGSPVAGAAIVASSPVSHSDRVPVDAYVLDSLMPDLVGHDRRPSALLVFLYLWRKTRGGTRSTVVSLAMMADGTGLAKRSVQTALDHLRRRDLI